MCCFFSACPPCSTATGARASFAPGQVPTRQVQPRVSPSHNRPARLHPGTHCIGHNRGSILAGRYLRCRRFQGHAELTYPAVPLQCAAGPRQIRVANARAPALFSLTFHIHTGVGSNQTSPKHVKQRFKIKCSKINAFHAMLSYGLFSEEIDTRGLLKASDALRCHHKTS